ncbi:ribose-phosphate diphosphokinase [Candidatus Pacearchaeota archaeon]|nr:ribose-phosphate diphosphokinase [Candidatus Pacearchaeota archaeon]
MLIAGFPDTREIAKRVAQSLGAHYTEVKVKDFPDSEFHIKLKKNPAHQTVVFITSITKDPDDKLIETILASGIAKDYGAKKVVVVATYFPYMRQDKHFKKYDSFSSKYILDMFKHVDKLLVIDPHLHRIPKMEKLLPQAHAFTVNDLLVEYIKKRFKDDFSIVGPDEESAQWSQKIADKLGKKVVILKKTRFSSTHVKIKEKPLGKNIIIIDDIISTGKTIVETIKMAKRQGANRIICMGIHGVLVNKADKHISKHAELITTNTIENKYAKIDVSPAIVNILKKYR